MLCYGRADQGADSATNAKTDREPLEENPPERADLATAAALALSLLWLTAAPRTLFVQSTNVHAAALLVAASFAFGMLAAGAILTRVRNGKHARTLQVSAGAAAAACALAADIAFLPTANAQARIGLACAHVCAGGAVIAWWGCEAAGLLREKNMPTVCAALAMASGAGLLGTLVGGALGLSANAAEWSKTCLVVIAFLPIASVAVRLFARKRSSAGENPDSPDSELQEATATHTTAASKPGEGSAAEALSAHADSNRFAHGKGRFALFVTLAFTSLAVSLFDGFTFSPHQFSMQGSYALEFGCALAIGLVAILTLRFPKAIAQEPVNALGIPTFVLVVFGMVALNIGLPTSATVPHGLLLAASDCLLALAAAVFTSMGNAANDKRNDVEASSATAGAPSDADSQPDVRPQQSSSARRAGGRQATRVAVWATGLLACGPVYGFCLGISIRRWFGYDTDLITSIASVCIAIFAVLYFTQAGIAYAQRGKTAETLRTPAGQTESGAKGDSPKEAIGTTENLGPNDQDGSDPRARLANAEAARDVMMAGYKSTLSSYGLSKREVEIASHVLEGYDAATIGARLGIQEGTVRYHLTNIYRKTNVLSKVELIDLVKEDTRQQKDVSEER